MFDLHETANVLLAKNKGILAADESVNSANKRLEAVGIKPSEEMRRQYRELFFGTDGIEDYLSGVILYEETLHQLDSFGTPLPQLLMEKGILPGIKVDQGTIEMPNSPDEFVTNGLIGLEKRLSEFVDLGMMFAKWRAVIKIDEQKALPTLANIQENARTLAEYARLCHQAEILPIIEPEVLIDGPHSIQESARVTEMTLKTVFDELSKHEVDLSTVILKTSMVIPGSQSLELKTAEEVAAATIQVLKESVPEKVAGVVFLSGGQSPKQAADNLNAIAKHEPLPWEIAFSYARAIQSPALEVWEGKPENLEKARQEFLTWLEIVTAADQGKLGNSA